jgi:hypothetical protein
MVRILLRAIDKLPAWQKAAIVALAAVIVLTWLAICVILVSYL